VTAATPRFDRRNLLHNLSVRDQRGLVEEMKDDVRDEPQSVARSAHQVLNLPEVTNDQ